MYRHKKKKKKHEQDKFGVIDLGDALTLDLSVVSKGYLTRQPEQLKRQYTHNFQLIAQTGVCLAAPPWNFRAYQFLSKRYLVKSGHPKNTGRDNRHIEIGWVSLMLSVIIGCICDLLPFCHCVN